MYEGAIMLLTSIRRLKELESIYAMDLAVTRQKGQGERLEDPEERLRTLALLHMHNQVRDSLLEFFQITPDDAVGFASAITCVQGMLGNLIGAAYLQDPETALTILDLGVEEQMKNFYERAGLK
jgi:hypothetical protein